MSTVDEADWSPIGVLAWVLLRDRIVADDPNLTTRRLGIPLGPAGLNLDWVPRANRPGLKTLRAVDEEIRAASRYGRLRWSGRLGESGDRRMVPALAFVEGVFNYDGGRLVGPAASYTWHALRTERSKVLKLWPDTAAIVSPQSVQPSPPSDAEIVLDYIADEEKAGRKPRLSGCHSQHPDRPLGRLRAAWPRKTHPLKPAGLRKPKNSRRILLLII